MCVCVCICICVCVRWTRQTIPLVNPTAEPLELLVANSNPRNYTLEMDSGSPVSTHTHTHLCASSISLSAQFFICHNIQLLLPWFCPWANLFTMIFDGLCRSMDIWLFLLWMSSLKRTIMQYNKTLDNTVNIVFLNISWNKQESLK